ECYAEIVRGLGEVHTLISESLALNAASPDYAEQLTNKKRGINDALTKARQFGSVARIALAPSARTVLTRFGDEWNKSASDVQHGIVARWGWLVLRDIASNDLFGAPREMSDEFVGDVDVKLPYPART